VSVYDVFRSMLVAPEVPTVNTQYVKVTEFFHKNDWKDHIIMDLAGDCDRILHCFSYRAPMDSFGPKLGSLYLRDVVESKTA
jgi:hypothetical protein